MGAAGVDNGTGCESGADCGVGTGVSSGVEAIVGLVVRSDVGAGAVVVVCVVGMVGSGICTSSITFTYTIDRTTLYFAALDVAGLIQANSLSLRPSLDSWIESTATVAEACPGNRFTLPLPTSVLVDSSFTLTTSVYTGVYSSSGLPSRLMVYVYRFDVAPSLYTGTGDVSRFSSESSATGGTVVSRTSDDVRGEGVVWEVEHSLN